MTAQDWNAKVYDRKLGFVSGYGESLVSQLAPQPGETILDLGCGTGDLAKRISESGASVIGLDASPAMIDAAKRKYPDLMFHVGRGEAFALERQVDAVFSNAALHWIQDAHGAAQCMFRAVKPGGRLAVEFGGQGNVAAIVAAIIAVLHEQFDVADAAARHPWYYPSIGEYASLLESVGWTVRSAVLYDRPTTLDGADGMDTWLTVFGAPFFAGFSEADAARARAAISERLKPRLFDEERQSWTADYQRIRVLAEKPEA